MPIFLRKRFIQQPQTATPIDQTGLGRGMRLLWNPAVGPVDLVTGRVWTANDNAKIVQAERGRAFSFDGDGDAYGYTGYPELTSNTGTFFMWCPIVGGPDTHGHVVFGASSPVVCGHQVYPDLRVSFGSNSPSSATLPSWFNTRNRSLVFASGGTADTSKVFLDGKDTGLTWDDAPAPWGAGNKNFNLGRYVGGTNWDYSGTMLVAGLTDAVWGQAQARAFHDDPWRLVKTIKVPAKRLWFGHGIPLIATPATQANSVSAGAIGQHHALLPAASIQGGAAAGGAASQDHGLGSVPSDQVNAASGGAVGVSVILAAVPSEQGNTASAGGITQAHVLVHAPSAQDNIAASSAIVQAHMLAAAQALQDNLAGTGEITGANDLLVTPVSQENIAGTGRITRPQTLAAVNAAQANKTSAGAISDGVVDDPYIDVPPPVTGAKPGIPGDAPDWLRTMLEIMNGRRSNKIPVPPVQDLTFSATPTQAECEALYAYVNTVRTGLDAIITRFDS